MSVKHCSLGKCNCDLSGSSRNPAEQLTGAQVVQCQFIIKNIKAIKKNKKIHSFPHRNQCDTDCRDAQFLPNMPSISAEDTKQNLKYRTDFTDFRRDASALNTCHHLKNKNLRSAGLRNGRLTEGGARRRGTWTSVLLGAAGVACHHVSQAEEECAAKHSSHQGMITLTAPRVSVGGANEYL